MNGKRRRRTCNPSQATIVREDNSPLKEANKKIADLEDDVRRLSNELRTRDLLLTSYKDLAFGQFKQISSLGPAWQDTAPWDSSICPQPSSSSTPIVRPSWSEVVVRGRRESPTVAAPPSCVSLSNRYAALSEDAPVH